MDRRQGVLYKWSSVSQTSTADFRNGHGFISPADGSPNVYVHSSKLLAIKYLAIGTRLEYTVGQAAANGEAAPYYSCNTKFYSFGLQLWHRK